MKHLFCSSVCILAFATTANAQQSSPTADANGQVAPPATQGAGGIADIVVTASRRAEDVQKSALSVQAISSEDLRRANVTTAEGLNAIAPGVTIAAAGNTPQVYIRGVGNFGTNSLSEGAVAFNLDGVYIGRTQTTRGMFYDLERVEVLKGPQGTLYGRNASGGAVNVITNKPKLNERGGYFDFQAGNYDLVQASAAINLPLGRTAAIRVSGQSVYRNGYLSDGYDDEKTKSARAQVYWEPTSNLSLLLSGHYQHAYGNGGGAVDPQLPGDKFRGATDPAVTAIIRAQPGSGPLLIVPQKGGFTNDETYAITGEMNWDLGFAKLTVLPAYRKAKMRDLTYSPGFSVGQYYTDKQTSVEVRLANESDALKWVLGAYFFDQQLNGLPGGLEQVVLQGVNTFLTDDFYSNTRSYAGFGQATYSLSDRLRITGGLRYTHERKRLNEFLTNYVLPAAAGTCGGAYVFDPTAPTPPLFCRVTNDMTGANARNLSVNNVSWKAGIEFDIADRSMAYANASTGFKSGGFYSAPPPNSFRPEKLLAFDAGVKNRFFDNKLQVNIEAFYWKYTDHQETVLGPTAIPGFYLQLTTNAGKARSYGADLDIRLQPNSADKMSLKVQYNKTKYDAFALPNQTSVLGPPVTGCNVGPLRADGSQIVDCSGKPLMRSPLWSGTANYSHTFEFADGALLTPSADLQFASSQYLTVDFLPSTQQKAYAIGGADLTYASPGGKFSISAYIQNIWNEAVSTQAIRYPFVSSANPLVGPDGLILSSLRPPRTFGGRIRYDF